MSQHNKREIAVLIMPWAGLRNEVRIGPVTFWPWDSQKVQDVDVRRQLEHYFGCFVDHYGKPAKTITICSHGQSDFHLLNDDKEYSNLLSAIDVLIFSAVCPQTRIAVCSNNNTVGPPSTDRYQLVCQKLRPPDDNTFVIKSGNLTSFNQIDSVHFSQPWYVGGSFGIDPDEKFVRAFDKVFQPDFLSDTRECLFRSLEWFRLAHTEADHVSEFSKLVMMSTAFEILLDFPDYQKSKYFADQIDTRLRNDESITENREYKGNKVSYSKAACWAWEFYNLRSKIVHGDEVGHEELCYKDWVTHNIVADLVFWELVVRELCEQGCIGDKARTLTKRFKKIATEPDNDLDDFFVRWTLGFDDYHRALGWAEPLRSKYQDGRIL